MSTEEPGWRRGGGASAPFSDPGHTADLPFIPRRGRAAAPHGEEVDGPTGDGGSGGRASTGPVLPSVPAHEPTAPADRPHAREAPGEEPEGGVRAEQPAPSPSPVLGYNRRGDDFPRGRISAPADAPPRRVAVRAGAAMIIAKWGAPILALALLVAVVALPPRPVPAQATCSYVLGFAALRSLIPGQVGQCLEHERSDGETGDAYQRTTGGMLVWRKEDNWTAFTDGFRTWLNGPNGLEQRLNTERLAWETQAPPEAAAE
ncbi:MAG: hypothetical protein AVDCRST_MAG77-223 [uncultured Chloroflexi bacterium]|uniref:Uncharacterized protein n=1 Tax=uncultured Chloroflexota bacterium TaxID=166587 RepID=A0A6J4HAF5_9CHLR|nr:MAG: hypothetical protein AVDCRST_MAG77-223 [uncultured Chloroflexota bacterium]